MPLATPNYKSLIPTSKSKIDWGGLLNTGIGILQDKVLNKTKTTGPVAVAQQANDYTPVQPGMPAWVIPVAIVGALLLFGKKLLK